jgi:hypothetical protein
MDKFLNIAKLWLAQLGQRKIDFLAGVASGIALSVVLSWVF